MFELPRLLSFSFPHAVVNFSRFDIDSSSRKKLTVLLQVLSRAGSHGSECLINVRVPWLNSGGFFRVVCQEGQELFHMSYIPDCGVLSGQFCVEEKFPMAFFSLVREDPAAGSRRSVPFGVCPATEGMTVSWHRE